MTDLGAAIATMFDRNIDAAALALREPQSLEVARARRISALLVETLGGYAFGTVAGQLVRATATWFGAELASQVRAAVAASPPRTQRFSETTIVAALAHAPIVIGREMIAALRTRLGAAAVDVQALVSATTSMLPHERGRASEAMFSELKRNSVFEDRLAIEISTGWSHACAVIERVQAQLPEISPRAHNLWTIWSRLAGQQAPIPTRDPARRDGYIARVG